MTTRATSYPGDELDLRATAIARAAAAQVAAEVDIEDELETFRNRLAAEGTDGSVPIAAPTRSRGRIGVLVGAAVIVFVGLVGLMAVNGGRDEIAPPILGTTVTSTPVVPATTVTIPATTAPPTTVRLDSSVPSTVDQLPLVTATDAVVVEPVAALSIDKHPNGGDEQVWVAAGHPDGFVIGQKGADYLEIVAPDGSRRVEISEQVVPLLVVGNVVYGLGEVAVVDGQPSARFVAVALTGPREGSIVAESLQSWTAYVELPVGGFARGATGVVDQARDVGATVIDYVDENGEPVAPLENPQQLVTVDHDALFAGQPAIVAVDGVPSFRLQTDDATREVGVAGPLPAWSDNQGPHIPLLATDRSLLIATPMSDNPWIRIPASWQLAAQRSDGAVVVRDNGSTYDLATIDPVSDARTGTDSVSPPTPRTFVDEDGLRCVEYETSTVSRAGVCFDDTYDELELRTVDGGTHYPKATIIGGTDNPEAVAVTVLGGDAEQHVELTAVDDWPERIFVAELPAGGAEVRLIGLDGDVLSSANV